MKKEDITNQILIGILGVLLTQNAILADALYDKIKSKKELNELMDKDRELANLLAEAFNNE